MSTRPSPSEPARKSGAERTRRWRERMRAKGLVPRVVWTYDLNNPVFRARLEADLKRMRDTPEDKQIMLDFEQMAVEDGLWDEDGWDYLLEETSSSSP